MRASEFIVEGGKRQDQDTIDLVKMLWDDGKGPSAIADYLGLSDAKIDYILKKYYRSRSGQQLQLAKGLTDNDKNDITSKFLDNINMHDIANEYGIAMGSVKRTLIDILGTDRFNHEMLQRKTTPGTNINNKITPEMLVKMRELYAAGKTLASISDHFNNVIVHQAVDVAMRRQPDYAELRAKRAENTRKVKHEPVATTKIHRPGVIDPQGVHGPGSRHRSDVDWQKLN